MAYSDPLAYFLTWTTYGTWLPGDQRGWFEKPGAWQPADEDRYRQAQWLMTEDACVLNHDQRRLVEATITDHCQIRRWELLAVNCRSNHVHVVVNAPGVDPVIVREQFKAWCTRRLKEQAQRARQPVRDNWWTERGSERWINQPTALTNVVAYVVEQQEGDRFAPE